MLLFHQFGNRCDAHRPLFNMICLFVHSAKISLSLVKVFMVTSVEDSPSTPQTSQMVLTSIISLADLILQHNL